MGLFFGEKKKAPRFTPPDSGANPNARWARRWDLENIAEGRANAFEPFGLPVGEFEGQTFYDSGILKTHRTIFGGSGSGKTSLYAKILLSDQARDKNVITVALAEDLPAITLPWRSKVSDSYVVDPSGMLADAGVDIGDSELARWGPHADYLSVSKPKIFPSRAEGLTSYLSRDDGREKFFLPMSQRVIQGVTMAKAIHDPQHATLPDIIKIFNGDFFGWVRWAFEQDLDPRVRDLLHPFHLPKGKEFDVRSIFDCINTVAAETKWLLNAAIANSVSGSDYSYTPPEKYPQTITLCAPLSQLKNGYDRLLAMHIGCATDQIQAQPNKRGTIIICDELARYCTDEIAKSLSRLFSTARKYNCSVMVSATSLGQLESECFRHGTHHDVIGNSSVIHYLNVSDAQTTTDIKNSAGDRIAYTQSRTSGTSADGKSTSSTTINPKEVPLIRQTEVRSVSTECQIVKMDGCAPLIFAEKRGPWDIPELKERSGKNPFWNEPKKKPEPETKPDVVDKILKMYGH